MSTLVVTNLSLGAGGLPDGSVLTSDIADGAITTAKIAAGAVTAADLSGNQTGSAPIYGARAWVNFNGTGTVAIRASGNVSSLTDNGVGNYTVNLTTSLPDANYAITAMSSNENNNNTPRVVSNWDSDTPTTSAVPLRVATTSGTATDPGRITISVFR